MSTAAKPCAWTVIATASGWPMMKPVADASAAAETTATATEAATTAATATASPPRVALIDDERQHGCAQRS
jgi:hypothetical protein